MHILEFEELTILA